jgi:hypothetical protein
MSEPLNLIGSWSGDSLEATVLNTWAEGPVRPPRILKGKLEDLDGEPYISATLTPSDSSQKEDFIEVPYEMK